MGGRENGAFDEEGERNQLKKKKKKKKKVNSCLQYFIHSM
jgi:hypothetical protein